MCTVNFENTIYVNSDKIIHVNNFNNCTKIEKEYYKKYQIGNLNILFKGNLFKIEREDLFYLYHDVLLKSFDKFFSEEELIRTYINNEHLGIHFLINDEKIKLREFYFKMNPNSMDEIIQEIEIPKYTFLQELIKNILLYNDFYSRVFQLDLNFWEKYIGIAKKCLENKEF